MVRLLLHLPGDGEVKDYCFNPTMVRLLQLLANFYISLSTKFQSHNGAIAA